MKTVGGATRGEDEAMKGAVHGDGWGLSWRYGPVVQFGMWQSKVARWKRGCDGVMEVLG